MIKKLTRARMEYGGWKELSRRLKRFHVMARPLIYYASAQVFLLAGLLILLDLLAFLKEAEHISRATEVLLIGIYGLVVIYWFFRIMAKANKL